MAQAQVVALGASQTNGKGVSRDQAYPAQLEAMLRARGRNAQVINAGMDGDTPPGMLNRLDSAVLAGTKVVILQPGTNAVDPAAVSQIRSRLAARGVRVIMLEGARRMVPAGDVQADGQHLTPEGYRMIASQLLPQVLRALGP
jgi:acyl-CoA thioesterase-1